MRGEGTRSIENESVESKKKDIRSVDRGYKPEQVHIASTASIILWNRGLALGPTQKRQEKLTSPLRGHEYPAPPSTPFLHDVRLGSVDVKSKPDRRSTTSGSLM